MGKKTRKKSVTLKMSLYLSALIVFLMAAVNMANYYSARNTLAREALGKGWILVNSGAATSTGYLYSGNQELLRDQLYKIRANGDVSYVSVIDATGKIVAHTDQSQVGKTVSFSGGFPTKGTVSILSGSNSKPAGYDFLSPITATVGGTPAGYFRLGLDTSRYNGMLQDLLVNMLLVSLAAVVAGIMLALVMAGRILKKPIGDLMEATEHIAAGDFAHRVTVRQMDELGSLATAFNAMTGHLANLFTSVRTSATELTRSSQVILSRSEEFRLAAEGAAWDSQAGKGGPGPEAKKQLEAIHEISLSAKKMSRLVDRLNSLSLQFKL